MDNGRERKNRFAEDIFWNRKKEKIGRTEIQ